LQRNSKAEGKEELFDIFAFSCASMETEKRFENTDKTEILRSFAFFSLFEAKGMNI
jgi:hypothetical protein